jgi:hypothetical protein
MKMAIICPSRGRPERFAEMWESALNMADNPEAVICSLWVDRDDHKLDGYVQEVRPNVLLTVGEEKLSVPDLANLAAQRVQADIFMAGSDDIVFQTKGWDTRVRSAFASVPDRILLAYTNDGRGRDKVEHFFVSREWIEQVGYLLGPGFEHFSADEWAGDIAKRIGRARYLSNVVTEHRHFKYGKAPNDETYQMKRRENLSGRDYAKLQAGTPKRMALAQKLRAYIDERARLSRVQPTQVA